MTALAYPSGLPVPQTCTITALERRALTDQAVQAPLQASARQLDYAARAALTFALGAAQCEQWMDWWRTVLDYGGAWFNAPHWPMPWGTGAVVMFATAPRLQNLGGGVRLISLEAHVRGASATPVDYADALELVALMREQLAPMGDTPQAATVYAGGDQFYVRPDTSHGATRDGTSYATAWGGFSEIDWGDLGPDATLWVCGVHDDAQLDVGASGSEALPLDIRLDHPTDPGSIFNSRVMTSGEWTASGVNGEYYLGSIASPVLMFYEDGARLHGPSTSSRTLMNVTAVDAVADTITHATERPFRLGDVVVISYEGTAAALPAIKGADLIAKAVHALPADERKSALESLAAVQASLATVCKAAGTGAEPGNPGALAAFEAGLTTFAKAAGKSPDAIADEFMATPEGARLYAAYEAERGLRPTA